MSFAYRAGNLVGKVLCKIGLADLVVGAVDAIEVIFSSAVKLFLLLAVIGIGCLPWWGVWSLYDHFRKDFAAPISINSIGEALVLFVAGSLSLWLSAWLLSVCASIVKDKS